ncbi:MAG: hypothetical protein AAFX05_08445 [Planctomycetota bacterium]
MTEQPFTQNAGGAAAFLFGTRPSGATSYTPVDPEMQDPALVSKWFIKTTPRTLQMIGTLPILSFVVLAIFLSIVLITLWTLVALSIIRVSTAVFGSIIPLLCLTSLGLGGRLLLSEARRRRRVVLEHDAISGRLTLHGRELDAGAIDAVERVDFTITNSGWDMAHLAHQAEDALNAERGTSSTTRIHLILRERLDDSDAIDPTSLQPGIRFHVVACTHLGLRRHGKRLATRLGVPYETSSLGAFIMTTPAPPASA